MSFHSDLTVSKSVKLVLYWTRRNCRVRSTRPVAMSACAAMKQTGMVVVMRTCRDGEAGRGRCQPRGAWGPDGGEALTHLFTVTWWREGHTREGKRLSRNLPSNA